MHQWDGGAVAYFLRYEKNSRNPTCGHLKRAGDIRMGQCARKSIKRALCEGDSTDGHTSASETVEPGRRAIQFPTTTTSSVPLTHITCPSGHWTHEFLACDPQSDCWRQDKDGPAIQRDTDTNRTSQCQSALSTLFTCRAGGDGVPYSLVCDHPP